MISKSRVTILVKASPQPSKRHTETVCCAGIDDHGNWRRLYPIRFRQLADDKAFARWNIVDFAYTAPPHDLRRESCRVHEESISIGGQVTSKKEKQAIVDPAIVASEKAAGQMGASLALIRPRNVNLTWKEKTLAELSDAREAFEKQARQATMFDKALDTLEPCRFTFNMSYEDDGGPHTKTCADWETAAAFFKLDREYGSKVALEHLRSTYCEKYVRTGLIFALGTIVKRPQTWQLLGIFPSEPSSQMTMKL